MLYLANGVTQIAEMTGMPHHFKYRTEIENGILGPGIFLASPKVSSQKGIYPTLRSNFEKRHQNYLTEDEGREAVRKYKSMGFQAIKISSDLDRKIYLAINDEAKKLCIPVIGHLPVRLGMEDLYTSGQSQLAHISSITQAETNEYGGYSSENYLGFLEHIKQKADDIAKKLKERDIVISSTRWLYSVKPTIDRDRTNFLKTIPLRHQNPGWVEGSMFARGWLPGNRGTKNSFSSDPDRQRENELYWVTQNKAIDIVTQALVRHGVTVMAGTDAFGAYGVIAGFSIHSELEALEASGLSNSQVLYSATVAPAKWMGLNTGKIEAGYRADLVLLNKNPFDNISHTRSISGVMVKGHYLDKSQIDSILNSVKEANDKSRKISVDEFL